MEVQSQVIFKKKKNRPVSSNNKTYYKAAVLRQCAVGKGTDKWIKLSSETDVSTSEPFPYEQKGLFTAVRKPWTSP